MNKTRNMIQQLDLLANPETPANKLPLSVKGKVVELLKQLMIEALKRTKQGKK